jgi:hypothetical protein
VTEKRRIKLAKTPPIEVSPELTATAILQQTAVLYEALSKAEGWVDLTPFTETLLWSEIVKTHLALLWSNLVTQDRAAASGFMRSTISSLLGELREALPELATTIDVDVRAWIRNFKSYYLNDEVDEKAAQWIASPLWTGGAGAVRSEDGLNYLILKIHYRICAILGIRDISLSSIPIPLYIELSAHFNASQESVWSKMKYV